MAAGFIVIACVLTVAAGIAGVSPPWWTLVMGGLILVGGVWSVVNWRRTGPLLLVSIGLVVLWMVGTLVLAR